MRFFSKSKPNIDKLKEKRDIKGLMYALRYERATFENAESGRIKVSLETFNDLRSIRTNAINALGEVGGPAVMPLIKLLKDSGFKSHRFAIIKALEKTGDSRAVTPLCSLLDELTKQESYYGGEQQIRLWIVLALGRIHDADAFEPLVHALNDTSALVRGGVVEALGQLGDVRAIEPLVHFLLNEKEPFNAKAAGDSLVKLGWKPRNDVERDGLRLSKMRAEFKKERLQWE